MGADGKEKSKTRAQQRAAGTKKTALFDMVNRNCAATHSVPAERAPRRAIHLGAIAPQLITLRANSSALMGLANRGPCA
jgi:hypothetical protein